MEIIMKKRKLFRKLGIGFLAAVMTASSVFAAAPEAVTENMTESTGMSEPGETEDSFGSEETESEEKETETYRENEIQTEVPTEKNTDDLKENNDAPTEKESEKITETLTEVLTEKESDDSSEYVTDTENGEETEYESESSTEKAIPEQTDQRLGVLTAKSDVMEMTVLAPDDSAFPEGAQIILYAGKDLEKLYGKSSEDWKYETFLDQMKTEWREEIQKSDSGNREEANGVDVISYMYPYYFQITDKNGIELSLPEDGQVYVNIYDNRAVDNELSGRFVSKSGFHKGEKVRVMEDGEVYGNTEKACLAAVIGAKECGLYSLVQISEESEVICTCGSREENGLIHGWSCPVFLKSLEKICDCGKGYTALTDHEESCDGVWTAFDAACSGCEAEDQRGMLHDHCEVVSRIHSELCECGNDEKDLEKAVELHADDSAFVQYVMRLADYLNSQTEMTVSDGGQLATENITGVSGWKNGSTASSDYLPARFYAGKSSMEMLGGSSVSGKWIKGSLSNKTCLYWLPLQANLSDRTSHGARYNNVIYDYKTGKWYDMKFVIQSYGETKLKKSGKTIYPYAGFYKNRIQFGFDRQGPMVIRCKILEAGTSKEVKLKVKIPVWDIDNAQYVGIKQNNGSMDHRYYYTGAENWLRAKNGATIAGITGLSYVEGKFGTAADDLSTSQACAVWEMTTSDFSFAFGYYNNGTTTEATRWNRFHLLSTNTTIGDGSYGINGAYGVVCIFSKDSTAPILQNPVKRVSADNKTWADKLNLSGVTGSYYYAIDYTVLDTISAYKFSSLVLSDTLPAGADYDGDLRIYRLEDGKTKMSWFTVNTDADKIRLTATADALSYDDFYGYTYRVTFKVKMDPAEMEPAYQASSGSDMYTVKNKANVTVKRRSVSSGKDTNVVTTTAYARLPVINVYKRNDRNEALAGAVYQVAAKDNITSPAGKIIYRAGTVVDTLTTGKDGKAYSGKLHPGTYTITEVKAPLGYALNKTAQNVKVSYLSGNTQKGNGEVSFVNKRLYSTIQVTKEIDNADIVWAHGNPAFTFKVTGKDVLGNPHTWYDTVEFTKTNAGTGEKASLTATFRVYAGTYTVSEEQTARYRLASVHSVVNGSVSGDTAVLHVEGKQTDTTGPAGSAVFYNQKMTDAGESHTAFVRNSIKK